MPSNSSTPREPVRRIAIVGTGVIGASWAAYYLSRGFDVVATDPAPSAESSLRKYVDDAWSELAKAGLVVADASRDRLTFTPSMSRALADADFVQENAPERPEFKVKLFAEMDEAAPPGAILASSSSGIPMDVIQTGAKRPERCVIGHPFNPPHIVPLVEVVGGAKTSEAVIARAMSFYASIGKKPIRLRKSLPGHAANRLQAALYKEILSLIQRGVLSVADADIAVSYGPGLRWAQMGPCLTFHLAGGSAGMAHMLDHFGAALLEPWTRLEAPPLTEQLRERMVSGCLREAGGRSVTELERRRDEFLAELLALVDRFAVTAEPRSEAAVY